MQEKHFFTEVSINLDLSPLEALLVIFCDSAMCHQEYSLDFMLQTNLQPWYFLFPFAALVFLLPFYALLVCGSVFVAVFILNRTYPSLRQTVRCLFQMHSLTLNNTTDIWRQSSFSDGK